MLAWGITTLGCIILSVSFNIVMVAIGSFLAGAGSEASMRVSLSIVNEVTEYYLRQKYSILLSVAYAAAGVYIGIIYLLIPQWRIVIISSIALPALVSWILIVGYIQ